MKMSSWVSSHDSVAAAGLDAQQLLLVVPLVERARLVEPLVALQPHQLGAGGPRDRLGELGLADAGRALDEQRLLQPSRRGRSWSPAPGRRGSRRRAAGRRRRRGRRTRSPGHPHTGPSTHPPAVRRARDWCRPREEPAMTIPAELDYTTCLSLLREEEVGRVAVCTSDGPRIVPVNYTVVDDDTLVFRTTPYSALGTHARRRPAGPRDRPARRRAEERLERRRGRHRRSSSTTPTSCAAIHTFREPRPVGGRPALALRHAALEPAHRPRGRARSAPQWPGDPRPRARRRLLPRRPGAARRGRGHRLRPRPAPRPRPHRALGVHR